MAIPLPPAFIGGESGGAAAGLSEALNLASDLVQLGMDVAGKAGQLPVPSMPQFGGLLRDALGAVQRGKDRFLGAAKGLLDWALYNPKPGTGPVAFNANDPSTWGQTSPAISGYFNYNILSEVYDGSVNGQPHYSPRGPIADYSFSAPYLSGSSDPESSYVNSWKGSHAYNGPADSQSGPYRHAALQFTSFHYFGDPVPLVPSTGTTADPFRQPIPQAFIEDPKYAPKPIAPPSAPPADPTPRTPDPQRKQPLAPPVPIIPIGPPSPQTPQQPGRAPTVPLPGTQPVPPPLKDPQPTQVPNPRPSFPTQPGTDPARTPEPDGTVKPQPLPQPTQTQVGTINYPQGQVTGTATAPRAELGPIAQELGRHEEKLAMIMAQPQFPQGELIPLAEFEALRALAQQIYDALKGFQTGETWLIHPPCDPKENGAPADPVPIVIPDAPSMQSAMVDRFAALAEMLDVMLSIKRPICKHSAGSQGQGVTVHFAQSS